MLVFLPLLTAVVLAAPVGDPVPDPRSGQVGVDLRANVVAVETRNTPCGRDARCDAIWHSSDGSGVLRLALLRGLGLYGEAGYATTRVKEADYRGDGAAFALGLKGALPVGGGGWVAADLRYAWGSGEGVTLEAGGHERAWYRHGAGTLLGVWREEGGGVAAWLGAQATLAWTQHVEPIGAEGGEPRLDIELRPTRLGSAVLGASLASEPIGTGFRRSARLALEVEVTAGQAWGTAAALGIRY